MMLITKLNTKNSSIYDVYNQVDNVNLTSITHICKKMAK